MDPLRRGRSFAQPDTGSRALRDRLSAVRDSGTQIHPLRLLAALRDAHGPSDARQLMLDHPDSYAILREIGAVQSELVWHGDRDHGGMAPHLTPVGFDLVALTEGLAE